MTFAPEDSVLLACSRSDPSDDALALISELTRHDLDWEYLVEAAVRHAMSPLLGHGLGLARAADPSTRVPAPVHDELVGMEAHNRRRNERLLRVAGEAATALAAEGVPSLALKDLQLVPEVYPDVALRPMGDLDLAVPRERYSDAMQVLATLGFEPVPAGARPYTDRYAAGRQLRRASDETWLDLQWHVGEREWDRQGEGAWSFDMAGLWDRAVPLMLGEHRLLAPSPEDMLLHLCVHLEGHRYCELILFVDLVELLRHEGTAFRWDQFVDRARAGGATSSAFHALLLAERLIGLSLPNGLLEELRPPYFEAALALPLFDNLTALHLSLDDTWAAGAPATVLAGLERLVRRQTVLGSRAFSAVDALVRALRDEGCGTVAATASRSPRVLPDESLPAFGEVEVLVEDGQAGDVLGAAAVAAGFRPSGSAWRYEAEFTSEEPALAGERIRVQVDVARGEPRQLRSGAPAPGMAGAAWRALALRPRSRADESLLVTVRVVPRAELLALLLAEVGRPDGDRLFDAAHALALIGTGAPLAADVLAVGQSVGAAMDVAAGLEVLGALTGEHGLVPAPRILEWARYRPADLATHGDLRAAWFVAWTARQLGFADGVRYLARGARPGSAVAGAVRDVVHAGLGRVVHHGHPAHDGREHAYWLRPEASEQDVGAVT
jgi:hypothetical protein